MIQYDTRTLTRGEERERQDVAPPMLKLRHGICRGFETHRIAVTVCFTVAQSKLTCSTCTNSITMSDLCPVYAPFFGAMVRFRGRSGSFRQETLIHPFYPAILLQGCTSAIVFTCTSFALLS